MNNLYQQWHHEKRLFCSLVDTVGILFGLDNKWTNSNTAWNFTFSLLQRNVILQQHCTFFGENKKRRDNIQAIDLQQVTRN